MRLALTRGRLASAVLAASMVAVGVVGVAQSSQAASTYTITPKTGPGGGTAPAKIVTVTGTGFKNATGVVQPDGVTYVALGTACSSTATAVTAFTVPTATQVVVTVPAALPRPASFFYFAAMRRMSSARRPARSASSRACASSSRAFSAWRWRVHRLA